MLFLVEACETSDVLKVIYFIFQLLKILFLVVPIGLIVMISIDFAKNIMADSNEMRKNLGMVIRRIIMTFGLFLVPTIVSFAMSIVNDAGIETNFTTCINNANLKTIKAFEQIEAIEKEQQREEEKAKNSTTLKEEKPAKKPVDSSNTGGGSSSGGSGTSGGNSGSSGSNGSSNNDGDGSSDGAALILKEAEKFYKKMHDDGDWYYQTNRSWASSMKNHSIACCWYVIYVLKKAGMATGTVCHSDNEGTAFVGSDKLKKDKIKIIRDSKKTKLSKLLPGDVVINNGSSKNISIFAYRKGTKYYFYTASSPDIVSRLKRTYKPLDYSYYWTSDKINVILRAK